MPVKHKCLHDGGSGLILNDGPDVKLKSVGWCLMLVVGLAHRGLLEVFFSSDYL